MRSAPSPSPQVVYKMPQLGSSRMKIKENTWNLHFINCVQCASAPSPSPQVVYKMPQLGSSRLKIKENTWNLHFIRSEPSPSPQLAYKTYAVCLYKVAGWVGRVYSRGMFMHDRACSHVFKKWSNIREIQMAYNWKHEEFTEKTQLRKLKCTFCQCNWTKLTSASHAHYMRLNTYVFKYII